MFKIFTLFLVLSMCSQLTFANPEIDKTIREARWQKRIVLLFDDKQNSAQKQLDQWRNVDFNEWDVLTIKVNPNDAELKEKYKVDKDKTLSILIGKDGTEKWRSSRLVDFSVLEQLIEKMPMRKNEVDNSR